MADILTETLASADVDIAIVRLRCLIAIQPDWSPERRLAIAWLFILSLAN